MGKHLVTTQTLPLDMDGVKVIVEGEKGVLTQNFNHANSKLKIVDTSKGKKLVVSMMNATRKHSAVVRTTCTNVQKMMIGVKQGYRYKMRLVYAHFPININITNNNKTIEIKNFLGEKVARRVNMMGECTITEGELKDEYFIEGNDLKLVSQSAARIHGKCLVRRKDIRKFLDGAYVWAKGPIDDEKPI